MSTDDHAAAGAPSGQEIGAETRQFGEHQQREAVKDIRRYRETLIREAVKAGNRAIVRGDYYDLGCLMRDRLVPTLDIESWDVDDYHVVLNDSAMAWDWDAILRFLDTPDAFVLTAATPSRLSEVEEQRLRTHGVDPEERVAERVLERAFKSLESIAVAQGIIPGDLTQSSDILRHGLKVGIQWQPWEFETPSEVHISNPDIHPSFTIAFGSPGAGKSTSIDTTGEGVYAAGNKLIDLLDFSELENGFWDVENQDEAMRQRRRELGLPESFEEHPTYERPEVEILHPMTPSFCSSALPYDTEREEFTAKPFTIPLPDLDHEALITQFPDLTDTREKWLRESIKDIDTAHDDWGLPDLMRAIERTEADEGVKKRLRSAVEMVNKRGYLSRRDHPHAIDWQRIFNDTETITVFTCSLMEQEVDKLAVALYLVNALYDERKPDNPDLEEDDITPDDVDYPRAYAPMREMQDVAPGQRKRQAVSGAKAKLYSKLVDTMQKISEKRRHIDLGILGDTQQWMQVAAGVRENTDQVYLFNVQAARAEQVFRELTGRKRGGNARTVSEFGVGECAVIGSEFLSTGRPFELPIVFAPPMCHHLDTENEPDGWRARVQYLDREEFRESPYEIDPADIDFDHEETTETSRNTPDAFESFLANCIDFTDDRDDRLAKTYLREVYNAYAADNDGETTDSTNKFGQWLRAFFDEEKVPNGKTLGDNRQHAYLKLRLTDEADPYVEEVSD